MMFRRKDQVCKESERSAKLYASALGIYELAVDGKKAGDRYFAPGFTSYTGMRCSIRLYDVTEMLAGRERSDRGRGRRLGGRLLSCLREINRHDADRQALLAELRIAYEDGTREVIGTDSSWEVTEDGPYRMADIYDGETYDASVDVEKITWRQASVPNSLKFVPDLRADYSSPVRAHEEMQPVSVQQTLPTGL